MVVSISRWQLDNHVMSGGAACAWSTHWPTLPALGGWRCGNAEPMTLTLGAGEKHPKQAHLNTTASSFNTGHLCFIGSKKASLLNSSSWLAGIVCISNPWSPRQSSIRSSFRRCLGCTAPGIYVEVAAIIPPTGLQDFEIWDYRFNMF